MHIASGATLYNSTGSVAVAGDWSNSGAFDSGSGNVSLTDGCSANTTISGITSFNNLTLISSSGRHFIFAAGAIITVNGVLTLQGLAGQPITLDSATDQKLTILLGPNAQVFQNNVLFNQVQIGSTSDVQSIPTLNGYVMSIIFLLLFGHGCRTLQNQQYSLLTRRK